MKGPNFEILRSILNKVEFQGVPGFIIRRNLIYKRRFQTVFGAKVVIYFEVLTGGNKLYHSHENEYFQ